MVLYCTEPFIITLPSSQYDLIMLKGCKTPNLYHISESFKGVFAQFRESLCKWLRRVVAGAVCTGNIGIGVPVRSFK